MSADVKRQAYTHFRIVDTTSEWCFKRQAYTALKDKHTRFRIVDTTSERSYFTIQNL